MADGNLISLASYRDAHEPHAALSSEDRWPGLVVNYDHFLPFQQNNFCPKEILIEINIGRRPAHLMYAADSRRFDGLVYSSQCLVVPAERGVRWELMTPATGLTILLQPSLLRDLAAKTGMDAARLGLIAKIPARDRFISNLGLSFLEKLRSKHAEDPLCIEGLAIALGFHLLQHYSTRPPKEYGPSDKISDKRLRKVLDYIRENLDNPDALKTERLAAIAGVSPFHFHHLFKEATGLPPHKYIEKLRFDLAKQLVRERPELRLQDIAAEIGFRGQDHFSRWFRKNAREKPSEFRKNRK